MIIATRSAAKQTAPVELPSAIQIVVAMDVL
jgi:hypothetical protein